MMNIIEAIKSGKRIKRSMWSEFKHYENHYGAKYTAREDILADDWEVEEKQVTITESDFEAAVVRSFSIYIPPHICEYLTQLKKELGL